VLVTMNPDAEVSLERISGSEHDAEPEVEEAPVV